MRTMTARCSTFLVLVGAAALATGCVSLKAPEQVYVNGRPRVSDPSTVPPTSSHAEARQKLAEAYDEIRYLRRKVTDLKKDKHELKAERDKYKRRCDD